MASNDFISNLPDELLVALISELPVAEAIRTGILSKRWKDLWRYVSHLDFDPKRMMKLSRRKRIPQLKNSRSNVVVLFGPDFSSNHDDDDHDDDDPKKEISRVVMNIDKVLFSHEYNLISCRIVHLSDSCKNGDLKKWIKYLISEKKVRELALDCDDFEENLYRRNCRLDLSLPSGIFSCKSLHELELTHYIIGTDSPFHHCHNLKTLKLKSCFINTKTLEGMVSSCDFLEHVSVCFCFGFNRIRIVSQSVTTVELKSLEVDYICLSTESLGVLVFDSLKFPANKLVIKAPNLRVFSATGKPKYKKSKNFINFLDDTKIAEILEHCSGILKPKNNKADSDDPMEDRNLFINLRKLSIDLDLNNIREMYILSFVLRRCLNLQQLEINIQESETETEEATSDYETGNNPLPYPESKFWEQNELCDCITFTLKQVSINGFEGKDRELEFARYLITKAAKMKRIEICCNDDCSRNGAKSTLDLLSLPRSSIDVSIDLKPGPRFQSAVVGRFGSRFERWVSTLK